MLDLFFFGCGLLLMRFLVVIIIIIIVVWVIGMGKGRVGCGGQFYDERIVFVSEPSGRGGFGYKRT